MYEPGRPTADNVRDLELRSPGYLDWNVIQYLDRPEAAPLLAALTEQPAGSILFSTAHLLDATALWPSTKPEHREERARLLRRADELSGGLLWTVSESGSFALERRSLLDAADDRCLMEPPMSPEEVEDLVPGAIEAAQAQVAAAAAEVREGAGDIEDPVAKAALLAMADGMEAVFAGDGLPAASEGGAAYARIFAPVLGLYVKLLGAGSLRAEHPSQAAAALEARFGALMPGLNLDALLAMGDVSAHPDAVGPMLLGLYGYYPDKAKKLSSPGLIPDASHARFALNSGLFVTGDVSLGMRVDAWAHRQGGGLANGHPPVVSVVKPGAVDDFERTAALVRQLARRS